MRTLHPVGIQEKFVASGVYVHYQGGQPTKTREHWSIHELPDGAQLIRVDDDWREKDGSSVLIEGWLNPSTQLERFDIHAFGGHKDAIKELRATFVIHDNVLDVGRSVDGGERQYLELTLPPEYVFAPRSVFFSGFEMRQLAAKWGNEITVISYLPSFLDEQSSFRPVTFKQSAVMAEQEAIEVSGKTYEAFRYEQPNPSEGGTTLSWLDTHGVLLKFTSGEAGKVERSHGAVLTRYARRPEPKTS